MTTVCPPHSAIPNQSHHQEQRPTGSKALQAIDPDERMPPRSSTSGQGAGNRVVIKGLTEVLH